MRNVKFEDAVAKAKGIRIRGQPVRRTKALKLAVQARKLGKTIRYTLTDKGYLVIEPRHWMEGIPLRPDR